MGRRHVADDPAFYCVAGQRREAANELSDSQNSPKCARRKLRVHSVQAIHSLEAYRDRLRTTFTCKKQFGFLATDGALGARTTTKFDVT